MTFAFNAGAALARAREKLAPTPTPPTLPTAEPEASGTVGGIGTVGGPGAPAGAEARARVGTVGTVGAQRAPDLDAFAELAALAEHEDGLPREEAERLAAETQGFASPAALFETLAAAWEARLEALALAERDFKGRACLDAARRFVAEGWGAKAAALDWGELELFGLDSRAPWERRDRMGATFMAGALLTPVHVVEAARGFIAWEDRSGRRMRRERASQADGAALLW